MTEWLRGAFQKSDVTEDAHPGKFNGKLRERVIGAKYICVRETSVYYEHESGDLMKAVTRNFAAW